MTIRVVVSGSGNMGQAVLAGVVQAEDMESVGVLEKLSSEKEASLPGGGAVPQSADISKLLEATKPDVIIAFSNLEWTPLVADAAIERGLGLAVGTTGLSDQCLADPGVLRSARGGRASLPPEPGVW